jgi:hypothetical protein
MPLGNTVPQFDSPRLRRPTARTAPGATPRRAAVKAILAKIAPLVKVLLAAEKNAALSPADARQLGALRAWGAILAAELQGPKKTPKKR